MTTTRLSTHAGELTDLDLQALKDYADDPNTPAEWRHVLHGCIEAAKLAREVEKMEDDREWLEEELEDFRDALSDAGLRIQRSIEAYETRLKQLLGGGPSGMRDAFSTMKQEILAELKTLEVPSLVEKPEPPPRLDREVAPEVVAKVIQMEKKP